MPTFTTPQPIELVLDLGTAELRIIASDRVDTVVDVRSTGVPAIAGAQTAERNRVEYSNGRLSIKEARSFLSREKSDPLEVTVQLPSGSSVKGKTAVGALTAEGRLGHCEFATGAGDVSFDQCGALVLRVGSGDVTVNRVAGQVDIVKHSGSLRIHEIDGAAQLKSGNGDTSIGALKGQLRASIAIGDFAADRIDGDVVVKSAKGSIRVGEAHGSLDLMSAYGEVEIGIPEGTAAWLDVSTRYGHVRNSLAPSDKPGQSSDTAEVRARTGYGDIVIRRSGRTGP